MRIVWFALSTVAITAAALTHAQEPAPPPSSSAGEIALGQDGHNRLTVDVMIDGQGPYPFRIDTGAERTIVSTELASQLALPSAGSAQLYSLTGDERVPLVGVGSLGIDRHRAASLRVPTLAEGSLGARGAIGVDSLRRQHVTLDFRNQRMTITPSSTRVEYGGFGDIVVQARGRRGRLIITDARIDGQRVTVVLDTGSETSVGNAALRRRLYDRRADAEATPAHVIDVTGGELPALHLIARRLQIGSLTFKTVPVALTDPDVFRELDLDDRPAMLLGMDAFRLFDRVAIDFDKRTARFSPRRQFAAR